MEFVATCPKGFEQLLGAELASFGTPQVRPLRGQVSFGGELEDAYRACLWSRLASRILLVVARVGARNADELYEDVVRIDWTRHLAPAATLALDAHGTNANLRNTQFLGLRTKDAIVDSLMGARGQRPQIDPDHPDVRVDVRLSGERATVSIDLTGEPLFRRGYDSRTQASVAQLRPDYAAALLAAGGWYRNVRHGAPALAALWYGQASVLVEAALEALDRAPGMLRRRWGFEGWAGHDAAAWDRLLDEADRRAEAGLAAADSLTLIAADPRPGAQTAARQALRAAGLDVTPAFCAPAEAAANARAASNEPLVVCDLSWLDDTQLAVEAGALTALSAAAGLECVVLAHNSAPDAALRALPDDDVDVIVGNAEATIRWYTAREDVEPPAYVTVRDRKVPVLIPTSDQFAARLAKVAKLRAKWARREDVSCYRVYDADLADYNVAIELYEGTAPTQGRWLQVSEYAPPKGVDLDRARLRLLDVLAIAPEVMGVDPKDVNLRVRTRARGGSQYADEGSAAAAGSERGAYAAAREQRQDFRRPYRQPGQGSAAARRQELTRLPAGAHLVDEGGLTFEVNFSARLDCGIFLDHRDTRARLREMMKLTKGSKRFLNLFSYTGTATCYAADGGAKHTTTVDLSRPSLDWARRNMARNGFEGPEHEFVQADVLAWVSEQRHTANRWDLVFCDVPTFSNSARMKKSSFDVQRDHTELIIGVSRLLTREGTAVFSCNLRGFKPDTEALERARVRLEDITDQTIPEDFQRNRKIHHCYLVTRF